MAEGDMNTSASDMTAYQKWEHGMLEDIGHDTDALIKMQGATSMSESYDSGLLAGMLSNKGIDPGIIAMLNENKGAFGSDGGLLFLLFLVILMGGNGFGGWGNGGISGVDRTVINESNYNALMNAVTQSGQSQMSAIQSLANGLNASAGQITSALASMDKQIAVNNGDIKSAIQSCCCNIRTELQSTSAATNLALERGFGAQNTMMQNLVNGLQSQASQIAFAQQQNASQNTQSILNAITAQTALIQDEFCEIRNREDQRTIQDLRDKLAEQRDQSNLAQILAAIANKDTINATVQGTLDTTAGTFAGSSVGSLS
jgi:hypothetical protein